MKKIVIGTVLSLVSMVLSTVAADDLARDTLIERLQQTSTLQANFTQRTLNSNRNSIDESSGSLTIARPLRFLWHVELPFEQQVISDGETLWVYDPDLEQATYQPVSSSVQQSPAMILVQPETSLTGQYHITEAKAEGIVSYQLVPLENESFFESLSLIFRDEVIAEIRIVDSLGQQTQIRFQDVNLSPSLAAEFFEFNAPEGTDLFEQM